MNLKTLIFKLVTTFFITTIGIATARASTDCVALAPLLRENQSNSESATSFRTLVFKLLQEEDSSFTNLRNTATSFGISLPVVDQLFPVEIAGENRDDNKTWQSYKRKVQSHLESFDFQTIVSKSQYSGFKDLALKVLETCISKAGLTAWGDYDEIRPDVVNIYFTYRGDPSSKALEGVRVQPENAWACTGTYLKKNSVIGSNVRSESCKRLKDEDASLSVVLAAGSQAVNVPSRLNCTKRIETRFGSCPAGQSGKRIERRQYCINGKPSYSDWIDATNYCSPQQCSSSKAIIEQMSQNLLLRSPSPQESEFLQTALSHYGAIPPVIQIIANQQEFLDIYWVTTAVGTINPRYSGVTGNLWAHFVSWWSAGLVGQPLQIAELNPDNVVKNREGCPGCNLNPPIHRNWLMPELVKEVLSSSAYSTQFGANRVPVRSTSQQLTYCSKVSECLTNDAACK
jgi:hypothetical protein